MAAGGRNRPSGIPRITCAGALKEGAVRVFNRQFTLVFNRHFTFFAKLFIETEQTQAILSQKYHQRSFCANMYLYMYFFCQLWVIFGHFLAFWSLWTGASWKKMQETDTNGNYVKKNTVQFRYVSKILSTVIFVQPVMSTISSHAQ